MAADERLTLAAEVTDQFSKTLDELATNLVEVGTIAESTFPIDAEVQGAAEAAAELEALDEAADAVDETVTVDAGVSTTSASGGSAAEDLASDGAGGDTGEVSVIQAETITAGSIVGVDAVPDVGGGGEGGESAAGDLATEGGETPDTDASAVMRSLFGVRGLSEAPAGLLDRPFREVERPDVPGSSPVRGIPLPDVTADATRALNRVMAGPSEFAARDHDALGFPDDRRPLGSRLMETIEGVDLRMTDFYNLLADFIPLMGVFVGAIPAAITAIGTLAAAAFAAAGALAAIGGLAALGVGLGAGGFSMDRITERLTEAREDILDALRPLAEQLAPMFGEALAGLERLVDSLAQRGGVLLQFRDNARALGGFILDFVPQMAAQLGRLAEAASPAFAAIGEWLLEADLVAAFARQLGAMLPTLAQLGAVVVDVLPDLVNLSQGFLTVATAIIAATNAIANAAGWLLSLGGLLPNVSEGMGILIASTLTLVTVAAVAAKTFAILQSSILASAVTTVASYIPAINAATVATLIAEASMWQLAAAVAVATAGLSLLAAGLGTLASGWLSVSDNIDKATKSLKGFQSAQSGLGTGVPSASGQAFGPGAYVNYTDNSTMVVKGEDAESAAKTAQYRKQASMDQYFSN